MPGRLSRLIGMRVWTRQQKVCPLTTFTDLGLDAQLIQALTEEGYTTPTPIQAKAIPGVIAGRDLLGIAQTGTGKTAAFALPILNRLLADRRPAPRKGCRTLVLSPTRELATQIGDSFRTYGRHTGLTVAVVFGGVAHRPQINAMARGVDVLVATPGRLIDHMDERNISLEGTEVFVLDEADQMLDLGFVRPIRRIVSKLSMKRQNLFFSATMPHEIGALAAELLVDPVRVSVAPSATTIERVEQRIILIEQSKKRSLLVELLSDPVMTRTLVFSRTKRGADKVAKHLETAGIQAAAIHGNKSQNQREAALASFRAGEIRVLVATDIAARGIDIDLVTHVINFELPDVPESYVHRIGRTARAGASGVAIALVDQEERTQLRDIERTTRQQFKPEDRRNDSKIAADPKIAGARPERPRNAGGGRGDSRGGRGGERGGRPSGGHRGDRRPREDRDVRADRAPQSDRSEHRAPRAEGNRAPARPEGRSEQRPRSTESRGEGRAAAPARQAEGGTRPWSNWSSKDRGSEGASKSGDRRPAENGRRDDRPSGNGGNGNGRGEQRQSRPHGNGSGEKRGNGAPRAAGGGNRGGAGGGNFSQRSGPGRGRSDDRRAGDR